jgi:nucleoside-diphosphate-sugar epimerase
MPLSVVTGGAGYFGETLAGKLLMRGDDVVVFDLNAPSFSHARLRAITGDVRNFDAVRAAFSGASAVYHAVAQVPLDKDSGLFWSVNRDGTENVLRAALDAKVERVVYVSSSAVFGRPAQNPVTEETQPDPAEDYGRAKYAGEQLCTDYGRRGLSVSIIRPRTIVGHGRLGIFQILFEWIHRGVNVPVLGRGDNRYQFVHADDLADACILAGAAKNAGTYNIGAAQFGTMRETLERLIAHARTKSKVRSVPRGSAEFAMRLTTALGLSPLAPYHALMYGESLWFDISKAQRELGFTPKHTQDAALAESYDWYVTHRDDILAGRRGGSKHQSALAEGILRLVPHLI